MSESFKELYDYCQTLDIKVKRNDVIGKIKSITDSSVRIIKADLDTNIVRGFFLSASNSDHPFVRDNGFNVIVLARGMNDCWERFVQVKEAMHLLDENGECTNSGEKFEDLINTWTYPSPSLEQSSPERKSDISAMLKALACLCPEKYRRDFFEQKMAGTIDDYNIALKLKIPQTYIPILLTENFLSEVEEYCFK